MKSGLLKLLSDYDLERESYISELEQENKKLRAELAEATSLMMARDAQADQWKLMAIMAGAFDKPNKENQDVPAEQTKVT